MPASNLISSSIHSTSLYCVSQKENWNGWCRIYEIYVWINVFFATVLKVLVAFFYGLFFDAPQFLEWIETNCILLFVLLTLQIIEENPLIFWLKMSQCIKLVLKNNLWLGKRLLRVWIKERETWINCFLKCSIWYRLSYAGPTGWPFLFLQWWALWIKEVPLLNSLSPCSLYKTVQFTKKAVNRENTYLVILQFINTYQYVYFLPSAPYICLLFFWKGGVHKLRW